MRELYGLCRNSQLDSVLNSLTHLYPAVLSLKSTVFFQTFLFELCTFYLHISFELSLFRMDEERRKRNLITYACMHALGLGTIFSEFKNSLR